MKRSQLLACLAAAACLASLPQLTTAAEATASGTPAAKAAAKAPAAKQDSKASPAKAAPTDAKTTPPAKDPRAAAAKEATSSAATDASPLMGAFQSSDEFLVTVVKSADGNPSKDVIITIYPPTDPKNPRFCMMFGDAKIASASQTKVRVTQYQPRNVPHSIPACSVTLEVDKDQLRLSGQSPECESLCLGVPDTYIPKQPLVRLKD